MLVLSRRIGEKICIGDDITVVVTDVRGDRVRLGFQCPARVRVLREELAVRDREARGQIEPESLNQSPFIAAYC